MVGNPEKRNRNLYYQYLRDHGHIIEDCRSLWDHLDQLVREGKLKQLLHHSSGLDGQTNSRFERETPSRPPLGTINVIFAAPGRTRLCVTSHQLKKKKKKSDCWFPRAPHLTPLPITQSTPSFLSLAGHFHSCSPFLFLFQSTQHTYTHSSPSPSHRYSPHHHLYHFFRQNH